jgi:SAM-dependent methyltransferase
MIHRFSMLERALLSMNVIPHPFVDAGAMMGLNHALAAAVRLGIVDHLGDAPRPASQIAGDAGLSEKGTTLVLDCLEALGYVARVDAGYAFTRRGRKYLAAGSKDGLRYFIQFCDWLQRGYVDLDETIRHGRRAAGSMIEALGEREWELFSRAMIEISSTNVAEVTKLVPVPPGARALLDVGGAHGQYSIALCERHPGLTARVLDLAPVRRYADECIARHGAAARVSFVEGNFETEELPAGNDVVLAFNIVHGMDADGNRALFAKAHRALRPGGVLAVLDQVKGTGGSTQLARATTSFMALNLLHQASGTTYSHEELGDLARDAGFARTRCKPLRSPGFALVVCERR